MRLDDWVLCRIYKKKNVGRAQEEKSEEENSSIQTGTTNDIASADYSQPLKLPRNCSLSHLWELDSFGSLPQLLSDTTNFNSIFDNYQNPMGSFGIIPGSGSGDSNGGNEKIPFGDLPFQYMDPVKLEANHNQPIFLNPVFQFE
ncbi:hypothetical protein U1Q18_029332 [Sarracenia purpurea var. burkii]